MTTAVRHTLALTILAGAVLALLAAPAPSAMAQSSDEIVRSLAEPPARGPTRSLRATPDANAERDRAFVRGLAGGPARAIAVEERDRLADIAKDRPGIDLEVLFEFDSAALAPAALATLEALGLALGDDALKGATFLVAGHTDAKGGADYNRALSERRARAVKAYLVAGHGIDAGSLIAVGFGKERLKLPNDPFNGDNRRVQIVNLEPARQAGR